MEMDPGAPIGDNMFDFTPGDVNMDAFTADLGDFGGTGTFGPFDMSVDYFPTTYSFEGGFRF